MAKDQLRDLHLFAMQSVLPCGMGIVNKAKAGGFRQILHVLRSKDPFSEFQVAGDISAELVRDKIDKFFPGLGHPVVSVEVNVEVNVEEESPNSETIDYDSLISTLNRINTNADQLRHFFENSSNQKDD